MLVAYQRRTHMHTTVAYVCIFMVNMFIIYLFSRALYQLKKKIGKKKKTFTKVYGCVINTYVHTRSKSELFSRT